MQDQKQSLRARFMELLRELDHGMAVMHGQQESRSRPSPVRQQQWPTGEPHEAADMWEPHAEVLATAKSGATVRLELSGVAPEDVDVSLQRRAVVIVSGVSDGAAFYRQIVLPIGVDERNAGATMRDGLLSITVSAAEQGQQHHLERLPITPA